MSQLLQSSLSSVRSKQIVIFFLNMASLTPLLWLLCNLCSFLSSLKFYQDSMVKIQKTYNTIQSNFLFHLYMKIPLLVTLIKRFEKLIIPDIISRNTDRDKERRSDNSHGRLWVLGHSEYWGIVSAGVGLWSLCFHLKIKDDDNGE